MKIKMKLKNKIQILTLAILFSVIGLLSVFSVKYIRAEIRYQMFNRLRDTAALIANVPLIQDNLNKQNGSIVIQNYTEKLRLKTGLLFITVIDMEGKRYSHPLKEYIGLRFSGGDESEVLRYGASYSSESIGHLGKSLRYFAPIYKDGVQVGAVCVGMLSGDLGSEFSRFLGKMTPIFIVVIIAGIIGTTLLAINIKKTIFGLEPEEIALLLDEKESIINNIKDGLIAVNNLGEINLINDRAKKILRIDDDSTVYYKIIELLAETLKNKKPILNREIRLPKGITIMANFSPIIDKSKKLLGAIVTFQDLTTVSIMAEELTGIKELTWDLRAQNHEFLNKLHTIAGLIQLEETDKALEYIFDTAEVRNEVAQSVKRIRNQSLQGIIFAKYNASQEAKIDFELSNKSYMNEEPKNITIQDLICIVGNLLENSIEELKGRRDGWIFLEIKEDENLEIIVRNNGNKIDDNIVEEIFKRGFSTKQGERGLGLYSIREIVDSIHGQIFLESDDEVTEWKIII